MSRKISYVIPCYRSEKTIESVVGEIIDLHNMHTEDAFEIVLVNDSSPDNVWSKIIELAERYPFVKGINLARNFGQHAALMAGYRNVSGDIIVCLDDDGQIAVEDTYKLIDHMDKGYDVVYGKYRIKHHSGFRNIGSEFARLMGVYLMNIPNDFYGSSFFAAKRYVIDEICKYTNSYVYVVGLIFRTTNKIDSVFVDHRDRMEGTSGYSLSKLIALWVNGATTFSVKPLRLSAFFGFFVAVVGVIMAIVVIIKKLLNPAIEAGWSSLMAVTLLLCGTILVVLGLVGEYVGRLYMSANNTPQYVIREKTKDELDESY